MGLKNAIRSAVVRTNPFPPFSRLNRLPYSAAMGRVRRLARDLDGVASLYLRHGMVRDDWVPGLSDIDLTVVLDGELSAGSEFDTIVGFNKHYNALRRWWPMLGEVELLPDAWSWTRHTVRVREVREWRLLEGKPTAACQFDGAEEDAERSRLTHALWLFETRVCRGFLERGSDTWLGWKILERVGRKNASICRAGVGKLAGPAPEHVG